MYKLICFDLDDTLWPCLPTIQYAEQALYEWMQLHKPQIAQRYTIEQLRDKRKSLLQQQPTLINNLSHARRVHFKQLADEFNDPHDWIETAFQVFYEARQNVTLFDDVIPVLSELKQQYQLAALTNGNAHIDKTGLSAFIDFQISAADVEAAKPHPAMFLRAMQQAGVAPQHTLHVGDHPEHDLQGARNAGIDAVWIRRDNIQAVPPPLELADEQSHEQSLATDCQQFENLYQLKKWLGS